MKKMKYIIIDNGMYETPVIFDEATDHKQMAINVGGSNVNVIAAGFIQCIFDGRDVGFSCYGRSVSLGVNSRPDLDSALIHRMMGDDDV